MPLGQPDPLSRQQHGETGKAVSRIDGPLKVRGAATFAAEVVVPDLTYAAVLFSTIAKGRIAEIETGEAEAAPGVLTVMTYQNAPRMQPVPMFGAGPKAAGGDDRPIMQDDIVQWNGMPVAVVVAETQEQADHAKTLIRVTYQQEQAVTAFAEAKGNGTLPAYFMGEQLHADVNQPEEKLAAAPFKVDHDYVTPRHNHNAIEPHAATILWEGDNLRVHDASQLVSHTAWSLSQVFGLKEDQVRV
ncbi:MAG: xanthine dehydrogenase family protein molybdopterin-binding subunit, partial [Sphingomonadales bacterium]